MRGWIIVAVLLAVMGITAKADNPLAAWFESLHRDYDDLSCCGAGDAYGVLILEEADPAQPDNYTGTAKVIDGLEKIIETDHGPKHRRPLPYGTQFKFKYNHKSEKQGNPTSHAWAFLGVHVDNVLSTVYCVIPLPPGV